MQHNPRAGKEPSSSSVLVTAARHRYSARTNVPLPPRQDRQVLGFISSDDPLKQALLKQNSNSNHKKEDSYKPLWGL